MEKTVSEFDKDVYLKIRNNVDNFIKRSSEIYDNDSITLLDVAPQVHAGAKKYFTKSKVKTADIDPNSGADYIIDICENNETIVPSNSFDVIVCTEVLEHTLNPFNSVAELYRLLRKDGILLISTPFNFRIHGPLPDCWRFSEHGLRALMKDFENIEITALEDETRFLMPLHYTTIAKKA